MRTRQILVAISLLTLVLSPFPVHAQSVTLMRVQVNATINVHRGPGAEHRVVGSLETGMTVRITAFNQDCSWLEMGPSVWIVSSQIMLADAVIPSTCTEALSAQVALPIVAQLPTPPLIPAAPPTAIPGVSTDEQDYTNFLLNLTDTFAALWQTLGEQLIAAGANPAIMGTEEWISRTAAAISLLQISNQDIRARTAPPRFAAVHAELINAAGHFDTSTALLVEGIDTMDAHKIVAANTSLLAGSDAVQRAMDAYVGAIEPLNSIAPSIPPTVVPTAIPIAPTPIPQQEAPTAIPPTAAPAAVGCDPNYAEACIPIVNYDLNCDDVPERNFLSVGSDPHNLDGNNDGEACEE